VLKLDHAGMLSPEYDIGLPLTRGIRPRASSDKLGLHKTGSIDRFRPTAADLLTFAERRPTVDVVAPVVFDSRRAAQPSADHGIGLAEAGWVWNVAGEVAITSARTSTVSIPTRAAQDAEEASMMSSDLILMSGCSS
jgi:hypothetical protein